MDRAELVASASYTRQSLGGGLRVFCPGGGAGAGRANRGVGCGLQSRTERTAPRPAFSQRPRAGDDATREQRGRTHTEEGVSGERPEPAPPPQGLANRNPGTVAAASSWPPPGLGDRRGPGVGQSWLPPLPPGLASVSWAGTATGSVAWDMAWARWHPLDCSRPTGTWTRGV